MQKKYSKKEEIESCCNKRRAIVIGAALSFLMFAIAIYFDLY